jgi:hypothetical protein
VPYLLSAAPFLLMLLCGIVLYVKSLSTQIDATAGLGRIGGYRAKSRDSARAHRKRGERVRTSGPEGCGTT